MIYEFYFCIIMLNSIKSRFVEKCLIELEVFIFVVNDVLRI